MKYMKIKKEDEMIFYIDEELYNIMMHNDPKSYNFIALCDVVIDIKNNNIVKCRKSLETIMDENLGLK